MDDRLIVRPHFARLHHAVPQVFTLGSIEHCYVNRVASYTTALCCHREARGHLFGIGQIMEKDVREAIQKLMLI